MNYSSNKYFPEQVEIVEVGPRDGLQNESSWVPTEIKIELIDKLAQSGIKTIEAASFVSPKWIPQMKDSSEVMDGIPKKPGVRYPVLTPNLKGLERALQAGAEEVAVFAAASEAFSQKNINCSISESIERFRPLIDEAIAAGITVRGYISCVMGCPYQGKVDTEKVADLAETMSNMGCREISLGDTIGIGTPLQAQNLVKTVNQCVPLDQIALHFHDTRGQALANLYACLELGISVIDSSVAGLGGCPYAKGASGNVATEDVLYMLDGMGIKTGIDAEKLLDAVQFISKSLDRSPQSRVGRANLPLKTGGQHEPKER
ncbi:MAG: hydroxymethylglutaryl-CoA lyase [Deltaproteobacteria bacterium]|nr:hydroxymethylglutaryl-CoA lyase [Deltaproteobacteria bacterium]|tara:strand:+ start:2147 stop:3097 length:951 start_codon:yes stop_codon:yes gene_type:complete